MRNKLNGEIKPFWWHYWRTQNNNTYSQSNSLPKINYVHYDGLQPCQCRIKYGSHIYKVALIIQLKYGISYCVTCLYEYGHQVPKAGFGAMYEYWGVLLELISSFPLTTCYQYIVVRKYCTLCSQIVWQLYDSIWHQAPWNPALFTSDYELSCASSWLYPHRNDINLFIYFIHVSIFFYFFLGGGNILKK